MADIIEPLDDQPEGGAELTVDATTDDGAIADTGDSDAAGQPRDAAGRYAPKAGADEAQTTDGTAADPTAAPLEGEPSAAAAAAANAPAGRPAATPAATDAPWSIAALGRSYEIPGTKVAADGSIALSREGAEMVHRYVGKGIRFESEFPRLKQELERARAERTERDEQNDIIAQEFARLATLDDAELLYAIREFRASYPVLQQQARVKLLERQLADRDRASQPDPEEQRAQFQASVSASLDEGIADVRKQPWAKGLTDDDLKDLRAVAEDAASAFLVQAPADDLERGIRKGETLFDDGKFLAFVQRQAAPITRARAASSAAADAARRNAAATQTTVTAPPSVGGNRTGTPAPGKPRAPAPVKAKSRDEAEMEWKKEMGLTK
jgi:hypothetical protein